MDLLQRLSVVVDRGAGATNVVRSTLWYNCLWSAFATYWTLFRQDNCCPMPVLYMRYCSRQDYSYWISMSSLRKRYNKLSNCRYWQLITTSALRISDMKRKVFIYEIRFWTRHFIHIYLLYKMQVITVYSKILSAKCAYFFKT